MPSTKNPPSTKFPKRRVRPLAVAAVRRPDGALLVQRGTDPVTGEHFHRLVGGGIEFGETAEQALVREWREELDVRLRDVELLGWLENVFTFGGRPGHELVAVHVGRVQEPRLLRCDSHPIAGTDSTAHWVPAEELLDGPAPLYPDGAVPLLRAWLSR